jgi:hypothetical protein
MCSHLLQGKNAAHRKPDALKLGDFQASLRLKKALKSRILSLRKIV